MDIRVTTTEVVIDNGYIANKGEYNVNPCEFNFVEQYTGLVKKAIFVAGNIEIERAIINDKCDIPYDVLDSEMFELHVYAYEVQENELVLRYSPTYAKVFLREGSYRGVTGSGEVITPTQYEQYETALNEGLQELQEGLQDLQAGITQVENVDIDASKTGTTATVTITDKTGTQKSVNIEDGTDYEITERDYQEIAGIVVTALTPIIPTKTSDLENNSGFIDKTVNNLNNYYTKTEVDGKVASVYKYRGTVSTYSNLPTTGLTIGDVYNVAADGSNYAWTGTTWDKLGGDIDLSGYYTKEQVDGNFVAKEAGKGLSQENYTTTEKTKLAGLHNYDDTEVRGSIGTLSNLNTIVKDNLVNAVNEVNTGLENTNNDVENLDSQVETIEDDLYGATTTSTTTGTKTLTNTIADRDLSIPKVYGGSTQKTTKGKNLVNYDGTEVTIVKSVNRVVDITPTNFPLTLQAGTYTFSIPNAVVQNSENRVKLDLKFSDSTTTTLTFIDNVVNFTIAETKTINYLRFYFLVADNDNATVTFSKIMLNTGSSAETYEPYTRWNTKPKPPISTEY